MKKYVIVAESGADLSNALIAQHRLQVVPMHVEIADKDYLDGSIPIKDLCGYYDTTGKTPKTSAVNPHQYQEVYEKIKREAPDAIIIHISYSSVLSCTYQNALIADDGSIPIYHIDSKNVSVGQAFVVTKAARLIEQNPNIEPSELKAQIENFAALTKFSFVPGNLDYLRAGGRVSNAQYLGASLFRMKPLIEVIDGEMLSTKKYIGSRKKAITQMINDFFANHNIDKERIIFADAHATEDDLKADMEKQVMKLGVKDVVWLKTGAVITSHSGPGGVGIAGIRLN